MKKDKSNKKVDWLNLALWLVGFLVYRAFMLIDAPLGSTIPVMAITGILSLVTNKLFGAKKHAL